MKKEKSFRIINTVDNNQKYRSKHFKDKFYHEKCLQIDLLKVNYDLKCFLRLCVRQMFLVSSFLILLWDTNRRSSSHQQRELFPSRYTGSAQSFPAVRR